jgi:hypothetical protein
MSIDIVSSDCELDQQSEYRLFKQIVSSIHINSNANGKRG